MKRKTKLIDQLYGMHRSNVRKRLLLEEVHSVIADGAFESRSDHRVQDIYEIRAEFGARVYAYTRQEAYDDLVVLRKTLANAVYGEIVEDLQEMIPLLYDIRLNSVSQPLHDTSRKLEEKLNETIDRMIP